MFITTNAKLCMSKLYTNTLSTCTDESCDIVAYTHAYIHEHLNPSYHSKVGVEQSLTTKLKS